MLVPAELVHSALVILGADLVLVSVDCAHGLVGPIVQDVTVGADSAIFVVVATHIDSQALALALVADT